ncbi:MAG: ABC transporter ATP-binding protein/permease [Treponemataceae bacterium]|nr:ABC transporter ATP-binding protein/permease [Treponemataceae bacterium]
MKTLLRLSKLVAPLFPVMILAIIFGTLGHFCAIGIPVLGALSLGGKFSAYFLILVGLARGVLHYVEQYCNHYLAFSILARIRAIVFKKLRSLGPAKLEGKEKGNLIALLTSDIELLEVFYAHTISPVCIASLVSLGMLIFFFHYSWILACIALFFYIVVGIVIPLSVNKSAVKIGSVHREEFAGMNSFLLDCLRGLSQSILYSNGNKKLGLIKTKSDELSKTRKKLSVHEGMTVGITGLFVTLAALAMLFASLMLYKNSLLSYMDVIVCVTAMFSSFGPLIAVATLGSSLSGTIASGKRVLSLLDEDPLVEKVEGASDVEFDGASCSRLFFKYPALKGEHKENDEYILNDISMDFPKNKIIGIQGKSGSGKSTLLKLFMHFYKAEKGKLEISGHDVNEINTDNLRDIESYVSQETILFHDTIENNIRIAKLDASQEEIVQACKKAQVHDFIMELKDGYQTQVAELGDNFSGGERQRLGLARAFLHGGDFILLDEPTSNLDSYNEHMIMKAVKEESKDKTVIIVSHRDSTFEFADQIYRLESGRQS